MARPRAAVAIMFLLFAFLASTASAESLVFDSSFGSEELSEPAGLALDPEANVWVADYGNALIQGFDPEGEYLNDFEFFGFCPTDVAADSEGDIWASFPEFVPILFDQKSGEILDSAGASSGAGLAVDAEDNLWVATESGVIRQYDPEGKLLAEFGEEGEEPGQFSYPMGIDVDSEGDVWVADTGNDRIQKLSPEGEPLAEFGEKGSKAGQLSEPLDVDVDAEGDVWVTDAANNRVQGFDGEGEFLTQFGETGSGKGQFDYPWGIEADGEGNVWVADSANSRIQKWSPLHKHPTITPEAATGLSQTEATLKASINPNGSETSYQFEYGTSTKYGTKVPAGPKKSARAPKPSR